MRRQLRLSEMHRGCRSGVKALEGKERKGKVERDGGVSGVRPEFNRESRGASGGAASRPPTTERFRERFREGYPAHLHRSA